MPKPNDQVKENFGGCEDLLKDFSSPGGAGGRHTNRFVSIDPSKAGENSSITSSPTCSPGQTSHAVDKSLTARSSKKEWGRAIDRYVASVLEDKDFGGSVGSGGSAAAGLISPGAASRASGSQQSGRRRGRSHRQHPDNHLLAVLENDCLGGDDDNASASSSRRSVDRDGRMIDDSSFEPINPFGRGGGGRDDPTSPCVDMNSRKERIKEYLKEERKPISLIALVVLLTVILSAALGGRQDATGGAPGAGGENSGSFAVGTPDDAVVVAVPADTARPSTALPTLSPTTERPSRAPRTDSPTGYPSYVPTSYAPTANPAVGTDAPAVLTASPTGSPTSKPTPAPVTPVPTTKPTPVPTTKSPSKAPNPLPTTSSPTSIPTTAPSPDPTSSPTAKPSTASPTLAPTMPAKYDDMKRAAAYVSGAEPLEDEHSAQSLAFRWLYYEGNPSTDVYEFFEQYAVAVVYFGLTRARMNGTAAGLAQTTQEQEQQEGHSGHEFTTRKEVCGWEGVRCAYNYTSETVHVTEIHLSDKGLTGTIPQEIGMLPHLHKLDLSANRIGGTIPKELYRLTGLRHLYLNDNELQGTISPQIDDLHMAEEIYLGQNELTGTLPSNIGDNRPNNWRFFSVFDNKLTGPIHEGMRLKQAYMLDFSRNQFYGTIPSDIGQPNYSTLRLLYLDHNTLTGTIPASLMQMKKMKGIFLNDNRLRGMIPYVIDEEQKVNMLTIRVQNNNLDRPVAQVICDLDVNKGDYELVELAVDCAICPSDCSLCQRKCY